MPSFPHVVDDTALIDANARIAATQSAIGVAGSGVGGLLVQALTAPLALVTETSIWNLGNEILMIALSVLLLTAYGCGPVVRGAILMALGLGAPMNYTKLTKLLREAGYQRREGEGSHEVWNLGEESVTLKETREVSPGLVAQALRSLERTRSRENGQ